MDKKPHRSSIMRGLLALFALVVAVSAEQFSYEGYKVFRVHVANEDQLKTLTAINKNNSLDFWSPLRVGANPIDIMVKPEGQQMFVWFLFASNMKHEILIDNVEDVVQRERKIQQIAPRTPEGRISFTKFNRHHEINAYLDRLAKEYPSLVQIESAGESYEGRDLKVIKISTDPSANKPIIFVDAGVHAREWVAPATATYIVNQLVENPDNAKLLKYVDWHILPVLNPDGYEYSHTNERFWRKTRSKGIRCYGADANRNFDFHWGERGASTNECYITYRGRAAFSEVESRNLRDYTTKYQNNIRLYLTLHSYGKYLLYPWGYDEILPDDHKELQDLGEMVANTIRLVQGSIYTVGASAITLYPAAGGSDDWVKAKSGVELSYTIELPGGGVWGFDPPPSQILNIVSETWVGIKAFHHYVQAKFG